MDLKWHTLLSVSVWASLTSQTHTCVAASIATTNENCMNDHNWSVDNRNALVFFLFSTEYATNKTLIHSSTCTRTDHLVVVIWARARITSQYADVFQRLFCEVRQCDSYCHYQATGLSKIADRRRSTMEFAKQKREKYGMCGEGVSLSTASARFP